MRRALIAAALAASAQPAWAADAAHPVELARSGRWVLNVDDDSCSIGASFGTDINDTIVLKLLRFAPGDYFEVQLAGHPVDQYKAANPVKMRFDRADGNGEFDEAWAKGGTTNGAPLLLIGDHRLIADPKKAVTPGTAPTKSDPAEKTPPPPRVTPEQEAAVTSFTFRAPSLDWYRLATGSLKNPMMALRDCTRDLVASWGYDPGQQEALAQKATALGQPNDWLTFEDWPKEFVHPNHLNAKINFRLDIDDAGKVTGCHIQALIGDKAYAKGMCEKLAARAKFLPARDASGAPMKSYYVNKIKWVWD